MGVAAVLDPPVRVIFIYSLLTKEEFMQIIHVLPQYWKETVKHFAGNSNNLYIQDHHLIKCNTIYSLGKLNSRELFHIYLLLKYEKATCHVWYPANCPRGKLRPGWG